MCLSLVLTILCLLPSVSYSCSYGSVRLYNAYSSDTTAGAVQYCYSGTWYSACYINWDCAESNVVCRQLGYAKARTYIHGSGSSYGSWGYTRRYYYSCTGSESSLTSCSSHYYYYCYRTYYDAGVQCVNVSTNNTESCSVSGSVQLTGGVSDSEGIVEFCYNGYWRPFCSLDDEEATVTCKQLGYQPFAKFLSDSQVSWDRDESIYTPVTVSCSTYATQSSLNDCTIQYTSDSDTTCAQSTQICTTPRAIRCYNSTVSSCTDGAIRLVNGSISQEGRVEVCVSGVWGSLCSNGWSKNDARVICKQLGYSDSEPVISSNAKYGEGDGPIFFSNINCQGWERSFGTCSKSSYLHFTCASNQISGTLCTDGCTEGQVRLVGGSASTEGTVEICHDNLWGLITDAGWDQLDAKVICQQLNMSSEGAVAVTGSRYGKPDRAIHYSFALCNGNEHTFLNCSKITHSLVEGRKIYRDAQVAGVICQPAPPIPDVVCTDESISLARSNQCTTGSVRNDEGALQYCYNGHWSILCTFTHREAAAACYQMGHAAFSWGLVGVVNCDRSNQSLIQNISCNGTNSQKLSDCIIHEGSCMCQNVISLTCFEPTGCQEGSVRIVNGLIENEGRIEVCINGTWGSICDEGWDKTDAHVVCQQLGFSELEPEAYLGSTFGQSTGPIVYSNVRCGGWETGLDECMKTNYINFTCTQDKIAGALCVDGCTNGDIRLAGGADEFEGNVQICVDNIWGMISGEDWDMAEAMVICHQLGYERSAAKVSWYPKQQRAVFLTNVTCQGSESSLADCNKVLYSLKEAKHLAQITERVAGVSCFIAHSSTAVLSSSQSRQSRRIAPSSTAQRNSESVKPTIAPVRGSEESGGSVLQIAILALLSVIVAVIVIAVFAFFTRCIRNRAKRKRLTHRPLPAITLSGIDTRYGPVESSSEEELKALTDSDEFPATSQEEPYKSSKKLPDDKEPLYEFPS